MIEQNDLSLTVVSLVNEDVARVWVTVDVALHEYHLTVQTPQLVHHLRSVCMHKVMHAKSMHAQSYACHKYACAKLCMPKVCMRKVIHVQSVHHS